MPSKRKNTRSDKPPSPPPSAQRRDWATLTDAEKVEVITDVLTRAGSEKEFRKQCLDADPANVRRAIEQATNVNFGSEMTVRFFPDQDAALKEILLLMPEYVEPGQGIPAPVGNIKDWLCTYITYRPDAAALQQTSSAAKSRKSKR